MPRERTSAPGRGRKTTTPASFFGHAGLECAIVDLATRQHLVLSLAQLVELGLAPSSVRSRAQRHRLHRIHHGVYSLVPRALLTPKGHWMAAVLACGPKAVLSYRDAAALHGLRATRRSKIDVTVAGRAWRHRAGIDIHRSTALTRADVTTIENIPCTSVARTLLDLAAVVSRRATERAFDQAEVEEVFDLRAITRQLERNPNHRGASKVRSILHEHYIGSTPTWSELEEGHFAICRRIGIPLPLVNQWVDFRDGEPPVRADFLWREQRVIVEADGERYHGTQQARQRDPRRDQRALLAGWRPIRTTWRQVMRRPHELEQTLLRLVAGPPPAPRAGAPG